MMYWMGQFCGLLATVGCVIVPFFRKKWQMLADVVATNLLMALNYLLIGQFGSATLLCGLAAVQGVRSLVHNQRDQQAGRGEIALFTVLYVALGFYGLMMRPGYVPGLNAGNLLELLPICWALLNMVFILVKDPQTSRRVLLLINFTWAIYSAIVGAAAVFAELVTMATTLYTMYRYRGEGDAAPELAAD